ncbi:DUF1376 domain-containing protein [Gemmata sp.]|uniref:DUF1376 domain-containing protein n=1 Tax=Gemmata sp. TaxID=1914242 RepID=UPI003F709EEB
MRPPFFAFYPSDFADDFNVAAMSTLQVGAYVLLLCKAWQADPPASLPNDDQILARLARVDAATWEEIKRGVLVPFRVGTDGRLHSKRLRQEYDEALKRMRTAKEKGRRGSDQRWRRGDPRDTDPAGRATDSTGIAPAMPVPMPEQCPSSARGRRVGAGPDGTRGKQRGDHGPPAATDYAGGTTDSTSIAPAIAGAVPEQCPSNAQAMPLEIGDWRREEKTPLPPAEPGGGEGAAAFEIIDTNLWAEFVAAWTAAGLPGAGKVQRTANRVGLLQQRLAAADWRERWRAAVDRAGRSAKLRGLDPSWPSGLRLDTFLKDPDMLVRVLEGEFDDAGSGANKPKHVPHVHDPRDNPGYAPPTAAPYPKPKPRPEAA